MALDKGWLRLSRSFRDFSFYSDYKVKDLFLELLLTANISDSDFQGVTIRRGEVATSYPHLAEQLGFSYKNVRTALKKLEEAGEAAHKKTPRFLIITITNYDLYSGTAVETARKRQANGRQTADKRQQKEKKRINKENNNSLPSENKFDYGELAI